MLKQVGNRVSGLTSLTLRQRLYHENVVGSDPTGVVGAPTTTKPQIKIDDKTMKKVEDYFMGGVPCKTLVGVVRNLKIIRDDKTGKIVGFENTIDCASSYFNTGDSKTSLAHPPVKLQYRSMLVEDAIKAAVKDYEAKKAKFSDQSENAAADA